MKNAGLKISVVCNLLLLVGVIGLVSFGVAQLRAFGANHRERLQTQHDELTPSGGVLFVGDSITEGGSWAELLGRPEVWNRGIGGDTTAGVLARMDGLVAIRPRQIFLMIGVNDLNRGVPRAETLRNFEQILAAFERELPDTTVLVQSVLPVTAEWPWARNDDIRSLNAELEEIVAARGLEWIDLTDLFADENGRLDPSLTNDGIHLLGKGYAIWRDRIGDRLADGA